MMRIRYAEFVVLMALTMSAVAMSTDAVLPALTMIGDELGAAEASRRQFVIGALFLGLASSQVLFGPLSDTIGRKPVVLFGFGVFAIGCLIAIWARNFEWMLIGRFVQGVGAAAPRVISAAIIRDRFEGRQMAKTMSLIMSIFILVPVFAPAIGQAILLFAPWSGIFWMFLAMAGLTATWIAVRLPETLHPDHRRPLTAIHVALAFREIVTHRSTMGYMLAATCVFSAFVGYLTSAQPVLQELYGLGERFPIAFGCFASSIGVAALVNSRLVGRLGMRVLVRRALVGMVTLAGGFLAVSLAFDGVPPLWLAFVFLVPMFFCHGTLFGNLNALAMQPMGHIAGSAASVIGAISTVLSATLGSMVGMAYDATVLPLAAGFTVFPALALLLCAWAARGEHAPAS